MSLPRYGEYKDSGIEWLGEVPAHWSVSQSRRMFKVRSEPAQPDDQMLTASQKYGVLPQAEYMLREGRRVVEVILGTENLKHVEPDDFIISMRSFQGGIEWCQLRGSTSFHYVMLTPVKWVWPAYFAHLLKSTPYIQALRRTTDLIRDGQELRFSNFAQVSLPVVPLEEQRAIATFLDRETGKIDALIAEQEKLLRLLAEKRQATISHAVTKGLNPDAPMKDSGVAWLGAVPEHWEVTQLKRFCLLITDGAHVSPETEGGVYHFVSTKDLVDDIIDFDNCLLTSPASYVQLVRNGCRPLAGDILFSKDGTIGRTVVVECEKEFVIASSLIIIRPNSEILRPRFLNYLCKSNVVIRQVESFVKGAGLPRLSIQNILKVIGVFPSADEQDAIAALLDAETTRLNALDSEARRSIALLKERRAALIAAAVTGKIDVRHEAAQPIAPPCL